LPEFLFDKIVKQVDFSQYITDDVLDVTKFTEAISIELKDWENLKKSDSVNGNTFTSKEVDDVVKLNQENMDRANCLLRLVGQEVK
jgi:hypothetical protein